MDQIEAAIAPGSLPQAFFELQNWYRDNDRLRTDIDARKQTGFVRECHGDLHLGNMALLGDRVTLFDCIEFNPELRWIDTISEAAFVAMDLQARGYSGYCWRFINRYLEATDDYGGVVLLRYYLIYRALVRAKVEALRVDQKTLNAHSYAGNLGPAFDYIRLARGWVRDQRPGMIVMHGLSGSGKSTIAAKLAEALGAIQIRSDVIRKRLFELTPDTRTESALDRGVYSADATESTYRRLQEIAAIVIDAGFTVILDATFLQQPRRRQMLETQTVTGFKKVIIHCDVPVAELRRRIVARSGDPSEATLEVLEQQQARQQVPDGREGAQVVSIGSDGIDAAGIEQLRNLLAS
jgi:predicted kinase